MADRKFYTIKRDPLGTADQQLSDIENAVVPEVSDINTTVATLETKVDAVGVQLDQLELDLAELTAEFDNHNHAHERWFGKAAVQTATHWAENNLTPFRAISGNNTYGTDPADEAQVMGTADTPITLGKTGYDIHRIFIVATSQETIWKLRIVHDDTSLAAGILAGNYSTIMVKIDAAAAASPASPIDILMSSLRCGIDKIWIQAWCTTDNATIDFFIGVHEF